MLLCVLIALTGLWAMGAQPGRVAAVPRFSRNRRRNPFLRKDLVCTFDFTTPNIVVTTDTPFVLNGIPQILTNTGKLPLSATWLTPFTFTLVYDTPGSVTSVTVPQHDPAVRSSTGGWMSPGSFPAT